MSHTSSSKSSVCLLICVFIGLVFTGVRESDAQYDCRNCSSQREFVPIYLQFGVDPYHPRQIYSTPFTPLQLNLYQAIPCKGLPCERMTNDKRVATEEAAGLPRPVEEPLENDSATPRLARAIETHVAETKGKNENRVSSPSDILLTTDKPSEPTLADHSFSESKAQLDEARKQIARLKAEIAEANEQAKAAIARSDAAEKAARAATSNAETSSDNQGKSDAEKRLAKLYADAKKTSQGKKKGDDAKKRKPSDVPAQQQVKNLQESMKRQIKNSNGRIRKRIQASIKKLNDEGKQERDPEVKALKKKMNSEMKENEAKIRQRVEERIKRIRKEAAARAIS